MGGVESFPRQDEQEPRGPAKWKGDMSWTGLGFYGIDEGGREERRESGGAETDE
ncbi:hypothetical protein UVI_02044110 [Ustilaginoidea virens]|uniref:Uncharacterized protein n=1 Tax=Ustilaginoidea virens TaxID=1159556 RepID=A0A1B5L5D9_USTVR|nr:hypothetical protein UVI_02044110 [Ustilaginoidea virens]